MTAVGDGCFRFLYRCRSLTLNGALNSAETSDTYHAFSGINPTADVYAYKPCSNDWETKWKAMFPSTVTFHDLKVTDIHRPY